jgi:hypothetical protein
MKISSAPARPICGLLLSQRWETDLVRKFFAVVAGSKGDELPDQKGNSVGVERF